MTFLKECPLTPAQEERANAGEKSKSSSKIWDKPARRGGNGERGYMDGTEQGECMTDG